ncbi:MAG TPA: hypothetical protein VFV64_11265 [Permianibacter sp.]|nr:hypothetical protein [Permianibacter sp.]
MTFDTVILPAVQRAFITGWHHALLLFGANERLKPLLFRREAGMTKLVPSIQHLLEDAKHEGTAARHFAADQHGAVGCCQHGYRR